MTDNSNNLSLNRKAELCLNHKIVNKVTDRNILCPKCESKYTTKNGKRKNKIRW